jgi:hypothetical protein
MDFTERFYGLEFRLRLGTSLLFGRLAQRQSIGLTLRNGHKFQTRTNPQLTNFQRIMAGSRKSSPIGMTKSFAQNGPKLAQ